MGFNLNYTKPDGQAANYWKISRVEDWFQGTDPESSQYMANVNSLGFTNETYRRVISTSTALSNAWNSSTALSTGDGEGLQVKPGYLVNPEGSNGYQLYCTKLQNLYKLQVHLILHWMYLNL